MFWMRKGKPNGIAAQSPAFERRTLALGHRSSGRKSGNGEIQEYYSLLQRFAKSVLQGAFVSCLPAVTKCPTKTT